VAQILPFCGWRYDLSQIGALADVLAPASSPLSPQLHRSLCHRHPCNAVRLVDIQPEPGDPDDLECQRRAAALFRLWRREGILVREHDDAFYAVQLLHASPTGDYERWSVIGLVRPEVSPAGAISPACTAEASEITIQQALKLRLAAEGDVIPVSAVALDHQSGSGLSLTELLQLLVRQQTPLECWTDDGVRWRLWPVTGTSAVSRIHQHLAQCQILAIAGADQLQAALRQQQLLANSEQTPGPRDPATCALICITGSDDPGMPAEPAVFQFPAGYPETGAELRMRAEQVLGMVCRFSGNEATASADAVELSAISDEQPCFAVGTPDGEWHLLSAPARCRTATELLELVRQELSLAPGTPVALPKALVADMLQVPLAMILAAPSPWANSLTGLERVGSILPMHAAQEPVMPAGLVFSAHTNVAGFSQ
jgi:hypothetical protein